MKRTETNLDARVYKYGAVWLAPQIKGENGPCQVGCNLDWLDGQIIR